MYYSKSKNQTILIVMLAVFLFCSISIFSQNYYWYKGEKIKIEIDSTKINITTKNAEGKTSLRSVELSSERTYKNFIDDLKLNYYISRS